MLHQSVKRPRVTFDDRLFWILYAKYVSGWRALLHALHPDTVVRWHRAGFRRYWASISRSRRPGRPAIDRELRNLIRTTQCANPCWGAPRIHGELLKLGIAISQSTVSNYSQALILIAPYFGKSGSVLKGGVAESFKVLFTASTRSSTSAM